ncbi:unnamed protein product [Didymodactylos carnosus]|nr:unnamed protein product [Didymodactylos carnosus]CAF4403468.1 unnamed protein product [Didymodactylos carnosus]
MKEHQRDLKSYHSLLRIDLDSILMPNLGTWIPSNDKEDAVFIGDSIRTNHFTFDRLQRASNFIHRQEKIFRIRPYFSITWLGNLNNLIKLSHLTVMFAMWLVKEEFTEAERYHHLGYLNYPAWYMDALLEYASTLALSFLKFKSVKVLQILHLFDCQIPSDVREADEKYLNCLHVQLRYPSTYLTKQALLNYSPIPFADSFPKNRSHIENYVWKIVAKSQKIYDKKQ